MTDNTPQLTFEIVHTAISGTAAAFRCVTELEPAGGPEDIVFPPTYEGGKYALVADRVEEDTNRKRADRVLLDSVQSQANRMELALLTAWETGDFPLPVITVDFPEKGLERPLRITSLEAPHRIADALIRDSLLNGKPFRKSDVGKKIDAVDLKNATALFELCPTALVFGMWDSTGPKGGLGAKFQRAIVSEIMGLNAVIGKKTSSRIDPAQVQLQAGPLYQAKDTSGINWTLDKEQATQKKKDAVKLGKDGRPSEANHGNVTPTIADGGVTIEKAIQTTTISLAALRRLRFPIVGTAKSDRQTDSAAQTALTALALCAAVLMREQGCDLRSRCQLFPTQAIEWELLDKPGEQPKRFSLNGDDAISIYSKAVAHAKEAGLPWMEDELVLTPSPELVELVRRSQQLAAQGAEAEE